VPAYPEPPSETSSYFYDPIVSGDPYDPGTTSSDLGTTAYDPSLYVAPATPEYAPVAEATAGATPFSVEPVSDDYWRPITLENEIAEDEAKLADLDAQLAVTGVAGGVGGIAVQEGETVDDQVAGLILGVGANAIAQQLQSERDAVVIRLNANRTALAELRAAGY
jgi:hypothetical protein